VPHGNGGNGAGADSRYAAVALGRVEELIGHGYEAFQRGDLAQVVETWHDHIELTPLPGRRSYHGREEASAFLADDIHTLEEFDFRIYTVLEQAQEAVIFGRYSVRENDRVVEKGVFWIAHLEGEKLRSFEGFATVGEAFAAFRERLAAGRAA
jgi:ketosteroid isomerase-like protein